MPTKPDRRRWLPVTLILLAIILLGFKTLIVDRLETPFRRESTPQLAHPSGLMAEELRLLGHNQSQDSVAAGDFFEVDLAWLANTTPGEEYQSNIWLTGPEGLTWSDKETTRPRTMEASGPTNFWLPGHWAWDSREVQVLPGTPPGMYDIVLTLFNRADLQPLTLTTADGVVLGPTAVIGQIEVTRPGPRSEIQPQPQYPLDETIAGLKLLGYNLDRTVAAPGEQLLLTFFWQKPAGDTPASPQLDLSLLDEEGHVSHSWQLDPVRADYPPQEWLAGEQVRGQHALRLLAALDDGLYRFSLEGLPLGSLAIVGPERTFDPPAYDSDLQANFAGQALLVGYSIQDRRSAAQPALSVDLVWQALAEMPLSYRVFVHLLDEQGQIVAQSDAEPAGWARPTTGWAPGEYILDRHQLLLPAGLPDGDWRIHVGLYDAQSGERLPVNGGEFVLLPLN